MLRRVALFVAALGLLSGTAIAQTTPAKPAPKVEPPKKAEKPEVTLKVGSKAPEIKADKWVKGKEVKSFEHGKVYVMEFWATWCPPCRESIPHLTKLQKDHKDVTVIGMASSERKPKGAAGDTRLETVEKFVKSKGAEMEYTVAYDANGQMGKDWLRAAGRNGIPCAFVVGGDGKIAWIGNPLSEHEEMVKAVETAEKDAKSMAAKPESKMDAAGNQQQPKPKS